ncbi:MAG: FliI/YscN family ATPase, partial [Sulfurihydrogenibium azorense]
MLDLIDFSNINKSNNLEDDEKYQKLLVENSILKQKIQELEKKLEEVRQVSLIEGYERAKEEMLKELELEKQNYYNQLKQEFEKQIAQKLETYKKTFEDLNYKLNQSLKEILDKINIIISDSIEEILDFLSLNYHNPQTIKDNILSIIETLKSNNLVKIKVGTKELQELLKKALPDVEVILEESLNPNDFKVELDIVKVENNVKEKIELVKDEIKSYPKYKIIGKVKKIKGNTIEAVMPEVSIGDVCFINGKIESQVVGFNDNYTILMTYEDVEGVKVDSPVVLSYTKGNVLVGDDLLGSILDPFGKPLNRENINYSNSYYLKLESINPLERERIKEVLDVGVKVINALITIGKGQRVGILAPAGVGKSTLLGMIARYTDADVNVIALIGERGREVKEFIEDNLGEEGLKKSVVVVATSDMSPLAKIRAVLTSLTIAKYFSDKGKNVLYLLDSLTRVAMAQREIGLSAGEPPTTKGYTPTVFTLMKKIIEQSGN